MKQVFTAVGKGEEGDKITVKVEISTPKYTHTREEQTRLKHRTQDRVFYLLRESGYMCHEIKIG